MNRPMPKSYMTDADREKYRAKGFSDDLIYAMESSAAQHANDLDAAWDWLAMAKLPDYTLASIKHWKGAQFIQDKGFRTEAAEKTYGKDWLERDV